MSNFRKGSFRILLIQIVLAQATQHPGNTNIRPLQGRWRVPQSTQHLATRISALYKGGGPLRVSAMVVGSTTTHYPLITYSLPSCHKNIPFPDKKWWQGERLSYYNGFISGQKTCQEWKSKKRLQYYTHERIIMQHKGGTAAWNKSMRGKPFSKVMD